MWLNFEYWITCQLCRFRCKSPTVYFLHNFSNILADCYFSSLYLNFHWLSSEGDFSGVSPPWPKKKRHRKEILQKMFLLTQSKISVHIVFQGKMQFFQTGELFQKNCINPCLWEIFAKVLLLGENFSNLILDFLLFYDDIFLRNFE